MVIIEFLKGECFRIVQILNYGRSWSVIEKYFSVLSIVEKTSSKITSIYNKSPRALRMFPVGENHNG